MYKTEYNVCIYLSICLLYIEKFGVYPWNSLHYSVQPWSLVIGWIFLEKNLILDHWKLYKLREFSKMSLWNFWKESYSRIQN